MALLSAFSAGILTGSAFADALFSTIGGGGGVFGSLLQELIIIAKLMLAMASFQEFLVNFIIMGDFVV